jgi:carbonic anhydrase
MNSLPHSPRKSARLVATLGIGLLLSLPLLSQPREQSPIDISRSSTVRDPNPPHLDVNYGIAKVTLANTYGSLDETSPGRVLAQEWGTLKAAPDPGSEVRLNGVPYDLVQFHFHTPSEHTINGRRTDMEVHLVHLIRNSGGVPAACSSSNRPLLVIGVFIDAAGNSDTELQRLFPPNLPKSTTDPAVEVFNVDLRALVPAGSPTWRYDGALTAPAKDCPDFKPLSTQAVTGDFPEAVHWYIYDKSMHLPQNLIDRFSALFPGGNSRQLKAIGERTIYTLQNANQ